MSYAAVRVYTMGTTPGAAIVSIGVSLFNEDHELSSHRIVVNLEVQPERVIEPRSVRWWMEQSDEAREVFQHNGLTRFDAVTELLKLTQSVSAPMYTRGEDLAVLQNAYPITFSRDRIDFIDIDEIVNSFGIKATSLVVCPKFYDAACAASADGATLRALWRAKEAVRMKGAA